VRAAIAFHDKKTILLTMAHIHPAAPMHVASSMGHQTVQETRRKMGFHLTPIVSTPLAVSP